MANLASSKMKRSVQKDIELPRNDGRSATGQIPSYFYRCPGCGEMVDGRNYEKFRTHHYHVLRSIFAPSSGSRRWSH
jgi:hypothetical protein